MYEEDRDQSIIREVKAPGCGAENAESAVETDAVPKAGGSPASKKAQNRKARRVLLLALGVIGLAALGLIGYQSLMGRDKTTTAMGSSSAVSAPAAAPASVANPSQVSSRQTSAISPDGRPQNPKPVSTRDEAGRLILPEENAVLLPYTEAGIRYLVPDQIPPQDAGMVKSESIPLGINDLYLQLVSYNGKRFLPYKSRAESRALLSADGAYYTFAAKDGNIGADSLYRFRISDQKLEKLSKDICGKYDALKMRIEDQNQDDICWVRSPKSSGDGRYVAYESNRRDFLDFLNDRQKPYEDGQGERVDIWLYDTDSGEESLLVEEAYALCWEGDCLIYERGLTYYSLSLDDKKTEKLFVEDFNEPTRYEGNHVFMKRTDHAAFCLDVQTKESFSFPIPNNGQSIYLNADRSQLACFSYEDKGNQTQFLLQTADRAGHAETYILPKQIQQAIGVYATRSLEILGFLDDHTVVLLGSNLTDVVNASYFIIIDLGKGG